MKNSVLRGLLCPTLITLGGRRGNLIFHTQETMEWSLEQSGSTPDSVILSEWVTKIQSNKDLDLWSTRVGSRIS